MNSKTVRQSKFNIKSLKKKVNRSIAGNVVLFGIIALMSVFMILPMVYIVVNAFKPIEELFLFPPRFFVKNPTFNNITSLFIASQTTVVPMTRYIFNSAFVAVVGTTIYIFISSLAAYPLAKHEFFAKKVYLKVIVLAILFRPEVLAIPQYLIISKMGLVDTFGALIFPALSGTLGVFMLSQFMSTIPTALLEAAKIDGAGEYTIFFKIVMAQIKPAWLTLIIFSFQAFWNTSASGVSYIYTEKMKMLPTVLDQIIAGGLARTGVGAAVALIMLIPPILIYLVCQGSVMETMSHSGIK